MVQSLTRLQITKANSDNNIFNRIKGSTTEQHQQRDIHTRNQLTSHQQQWHTQHLHQQGFRIPRALQQQRDITASKKDLMLHNFVQKGQHFVTPTNGSRPPRIDDDWTAKAQQTLKNEHHTRMNTTPLKKRRRCTATSSHSKRIVTSARRRIIARKAS